MSWQDIALKWEKFEGLGDYLKIQLENFSEKEKEEAFYAPLPYEYLYSSSSNRRVSAIN